MALSDEHRMILEDMNKAIRELCELSEDFKFRMEMLLNNQFPEELPTVISLKLMLAYCDMVFLEMSNKTLHDGYFKIKKLELELEK